MFLSSFSRILLVYLNGKEDVRSVNAEQGCSHRELRIIANSNNWKRVYLTSRITALSSTKLHYIFHSYLTDKTHFLTLMCLFPGLGAGRPQAMEKGLGNEVGWWSNQWRQGGSSSPFQFLEKNENLKISLYGMKFTSILPQGWLAKCGNFSKFEYHMRMITFQNVLGHGWITSSWTTSRNFCEGLECSIFLRVISKTLHTVVHIKKDSTAKSCVFF